MFFSRFCRAEWWPYWIYFLRSVLQCVTAWANYSLVTLHHKVYWMRAASSVWQQSNLVRSFDLKPLDSWAETDFLILLLDVIEQILFQLQLLLQLLLILENGFVKQCRGLLLCQFWLNSSGLGVVWVNKLLNVARPMHTAFELVLCCNGRCLQL